MLGHPTCTFADSTATASAEILSNLRGLGLLSLRPSPSPETGRCFLQVQVPVPVSKFMQMRDSKLEHHTRV